MKNILEYVSKNLKTFSEMPINDIDCLVLSWISYYHVPNEVYKQKSFKSLQLKELYNAKYFDKMLFDVFDIESSKNLLSYVAASPRFRNVKMFYYIEQMSKRIEKQFSAMTFEISKNTYCVVFRGTDHSFVGWKEDFNMSFKKSIPSQIESVKYLNKICESFKGKIYVAGHSKGGNLAVYAGTYTKENNQGKIVSIYNFDGPSLNASHIDTKSFANIKNKIKKIVPQSSIVGMCFESTTDYSIIKSHSIGVLQHSPFSWEVKNSKFVQIKSTTVDSKAFKKGVNSLVSNLTEKELKTFVNTLYSVLSDTNLSDFDTLSKDILGNLGIIFSSFNNLDDNKKQLIFKVATLFIKQSFKN